MIPREGLTGWISGPSEQAQRIQEDHQDWVIMWSAWHRTFTAFSCFSRDPIVVDEPTADGLVTAMDRIKPPGSLTLIGFTDRTSAHCSVAAASPPVPQNMPSHAEGTSPPMNNHALPLPPFSPTTATPARVYDYYLGGKDNYFADREAGDKVLAAFPQASRLARENRGFLLRAVRYCAEAGIDQFIDLGTGIPTSPNVAEIACAFNRRARVIGVDNDPVVLNHQRADVSSSPGSYTIIQGDVRRPWAILADPRLGAVIDLSRRVAVLCVAVLHFIPEADSPAGIIAAFTETMATGSFIAVSAVTSTDTDPALIAPIQDAYTNASAPVIFRTADHIRSWFTGMDLVAPGLVDVSQWPNARIALATDVRILGGLARKSPGDPL